MNNFKPMLAAEADLNTLKFPLAASAKLDGIRCVIQGGEGLTRSLKKIPNKHIQGLLRTLPNGLDGELIVGSATDKNVMQATTSGVMRVEEEPIFSFHVFDYVGSPNDTYMARYESLKEVMRNVKECFVATHFHQIVNTLQELLHYEEYCLNMGYEGLILRALDAPYKFGRSTAKQQGMLKLKRFTDAEAIIIGIEQFMHNANEAQTNELGRTKRSSNAEGLVPVEKMGALIVRDIEHGWEFSIGTGFTEELRKEFWENDWKGVIVKYKYFSHGMVDVPRHPVFLGIRDKKDM